jgi:hypothetical protein
MDLASSSEARSFASTLRMTYAELSVFIHEPSFGQFSSRLGGG